LINAVFNAGADDMWDQLQSLWDNHFQEACTTLGDALSSSFEATDVEAKTLAGSMRFSMGLSIVDQAEHAATMVEIKMKNRFDRLFRYDENLLPRRWHEPAEIDESFKIARDQVLLFACSFLNFLLASNMTKLSRL